MSEVVRATRTEILDVLKTREVRLKDPHVSHHLKVSVSEVVPSEVRVTAPEADLIRIGGVRLLLTTSIAAVVLHDQNGASSVASRIPLSMFARFTATL